MSYPYTILGIQCVPQTHALTSNAKYILPFSPIYNKRCAPMMMHYSGMNNLHTKDDGLEQNNIYYKKNYNPIYYTTKHKHNNYYNHSYSSPKKQVPKNCTRCTTDS